MEMDDDSYNSEKLQAESKDEDESKIRQEHPVWVMRNDLKDYKCVTRTLFPSRHQFKEAIMTYVVQSGRNLKFNKNDKVRVRVECKYVLLLKFVFL